MLYTRDMTEESEDEFAAESLRLARLLHSLAKDRGISVRSMEKKMKVGDSVFAKVLQGKVTLQVRHLLMICKAIGITPEEFFARAYGIEPPVSDVDLERKLIRILARFGVLDPAKGSSPPAPEEPSPDQH
jgi:transcriptional regulator with XRE-family HTH domain